MDFVDLIVTVHGRLDDVGISHAFGGALALGYVAEPRGTVDIDVNVFVPPEQVDDVGDALRPIGFVQPTQVSDPDIAGGSV